MQKEGIDKIDFTSACRPRLLDGSHVAFPLRMCIPDASSLLMKTPVLLNEGSTLRTSFRLTYRMKSSSPNTVSLGVRASGMNSGRTQLSPYQCPNLACPPPTSPDPSFTATNYFLVPYLHPPATPALSLGWTAQSLSSCILCGSRRSPGLLRM